MMTTRTRRLIGASVLVLLVSACGSKRSYVFVPDRDPKSPPIEDTSRPDNWQCGRVELWVKGDNGPIDKFDMGHVCRDDQGQK